MAKKRLMSKLGALIVVAILASGAVAQAEESYISNIDALEQTVTLYERLRNAEVQVPTEMEKSGLDEEFLKSVVLGYANLEDSAQIYGADTISKQDLMNVLYKTVINYDDSYAISGEEADAILNGCYDNAYIAEENRIAYAFMIKQGIISGKSGSEPDKAITRENCENLINQVYSLFAKEITFDFDGMSITTGANISTVTDVLGQPNRIDESLYGFKWYVYNSEPTKFIMIGVQADRICSVYSNSKAFDIGGVSVGDAYVRAADYKGDKNFTFYTDTKGNIDAILYNIYDKEADYSEAAEKAAASQILDMINAYRAKNGQAGYLPDQSLCDEAAEAAGTYMNDGTVQDGVRCESGFDPFCVYYALLRNDDALLTSESDKDVLAGVNTYVDDNCSVVFTLKTGNTAKPKKTDPPTVVQEQTDYTLKTVSEVTTPVIVTPKAEILYNEGEDVVIELAMQAATQYHIEVFDVENDSYAVNEYVKTDSTKIVLPAELFKRGADYRMVVSSITPEGYSLSADDVLFSYGAAYDDGIEILTPFDNRSTDDDYLAVSWKSDQYHDFVLDLYDSEGKLVTSEILKDEYEAVIRGVDPGEYYIYVTALRRNTNIEKAQASVKVTVSMPTPVITETILDEDDTYYFVYEDKAMGVLYFYDEEIVDVDVKGSNGKTTTVKKKKIIQKQVKATKAYKELAQNRRIVESVSGKPTLDFISSVPASEMGQKIVNEASKYLGVPYVWGGTTPDGFDCSGLVQYVLNSLGIDISRVTQTQCQEGVPVAKGDLQPGDLVFFESNGDVHHVGIYIGNGQMLHAPRTGDVVRIQDMNTPYYTSTYYGARRVY